MFALKIKDKYFLEIKDNSITTTEKFTKAKHYKTEEEAKTAKKEICKKTGSILEIEEYWRIPE